MTEQGMDLADDVRELTAPHIHRERYQARQGPAWYDRHHITRTPSLLTQLWQNDIPSQAADDGPRAG